MEVQLVVIALGCFLASIVNAALATGGIYITLAATTAVLPVGVAIPLQTVLALPSLLGRIYLCWHGINWQIVRMFLPMAAAGSVIGAGVFVALDEGIIALSLGILLLALIWLVPRGVTLKLPRRFVYIGGIHGFFSTIFGVGMFLQPAVLRTDLARLQITGTLAACIMALEVVKAGGYAGFGFDYADYLPHVLAGSVASLFGNAAGHRLGHHVSETRFRLIFKLIVTLVGVRLVIKGALLLAG